MDAIVDVITDLFIRTDTRDWEGVKKLFAPEVAFDMGQPAKMTPQQIVDAWKTGLAPIEQIHHQAGNFKVNVRGDEADAFCYGIAFHYRKTTSGQNTRTFVGSYEFKLRRAGSDWKITAFKFNLKFIDGNVNLEE
jgi:hypothetical protein